MSLTHFQKVIVWCYLEEIEEYIEDFDEKAYSENPERDVEEFIIHVRSALDTLQEVLDDKSR